MALEVTIYELISPLGNTAHAYTDKEDAYYEANRRISEFGDCYKVEETSLTVSDTFLKRMYLLELDRLKKEKLEE